MDFPNKLNRVLSRVELIKETSRRIKQRKFLAESKKPQEGPFYWVPLPGGVWELMSWYVEALGIDNTDHTEVWSKSAAPYMAEQWGLDERRLARLPYSVPRGRVSKGYNSTTASSVMYINNGGDSPVPEEEMVRRVCREFNLTGVLLKNPSKIKPAYDNHHRTLPSQASALKSMLASAGQLV